MDRDMRGLSVSGKTADGSRSEPTAPKTRWQAYCDPEDPLCPQYHWNRVKEILQQGWALRQQAITGEDCPPTVTDELVRAIAGRRVSRSPGRLEELMTRAAEAKCRPANKDKRQAERLKLNRDLAHWEIREALRDYLCRVSEKREAEEALRLQEWQQQLREMLSEEMD